MDFGSRKILAGLIAFLSLAGCTFGVPAADGDAVRGLWLCPMNRGLYVVEQIGEKDRSWVRIGTRRDAEPVSWDQRMGTVRTAAALGDALFMAFDNGLIVRNAEATPQIELRRLGDQLAPRRLIVDAAQGRLFVLARGPMSTTMAASAPHWASTIWRLYELAGGNWRLVALLPREIEATAGPVMWADNGRLELFGRVEADGRSRLQHWFYREGQWVSQLVIDLGTTILEYWPLSLDGESLTVGAKPVKGGRELYIYHLLPGSQVSKVGPLTVGTKPLVLKQSFAVAAEADRIVVGALSEDATQIKLARWTAGGDSVGAWEPLDHPVVPKGQEPSFWLFLLLILVILSILFSRRNPPSTVQDMPAQMVPATYWRRLLALAMDLSLIFLGVMLVLEVTVPDWIRELSDPMVLSRFLETRQASTHMHIIGLIFNVALLVYGTVMEGLFGWTIGKWVFRLEVRQARAMGDRILWRQAIARNIFKILELQFLPMLLVVFFTRSRQRIGDLVAGTIVLEHQKARENGTGGYDRPPDNGDEGF